MCPAFIVSASDIEEKVFFYPNSDEPIGRGRALGRAVGLEVLGVNLDRLLPGERSSWPHAEADEEEFVYVVAGKVDCWIDGHIHALKSGDFVGFPKATGISHCFINNSDAEVVLLVGGEKSRPGSRCCYPLNPSRIDDDPLCGWEPPVRTLLGPHDALPDLLRARLARKQKESA